MIAWFIGLTLDHQSHVICVAVIILGLIVIISFSGQRRINEQEELRQEQEKMIGKMS